MWTRFPYLHALLTGSVEGERKRALEDLQVAMAARQTQAQHRAFIKARAATNNALRMGV